MAARASRLGIKVATIERYSKEYPEEVDEWWYKLAEEVDKHLAASMQRGINQAMGLLGKAEDKGSIQ